MLTGLCLLTAGSLTQAIRNFAKSLEGWLKNAMQGIPEEMIKAKVGQETSMNLTNKSVLVVVVCFFFLGGEGQSCSGKSCLSFASMN